VVKVRDEDLELIPSDSSRVRIPPQKAKPHTYYNPPERIDIDSLGGKSSTSDSKGVSDDGEDPAMIKSFRLSVEDAGSVWPFETAGVVKCAREWKAKIAEASSTIPTSSNQATFISSSSFVGWEVKSDLKQILSSIPGKDGREVIPENELQAQLNSTARLLHQRGSSDKVALKAALNLALTWVHCHMLSKAGDLLKSVTGTCLSHSDPRFYFGALQVMGFLQFKMGNYAVAAQMFRKLLGIIGKEDSSAVRENLAYCLMCICNGRSMLEAEAVLTEALLTAPGGDESGTPSPPGCPLAFAAAAKPEVAQRLKLARKAPSGPQYTEGGTQLALAICKYLRGATRDALETVQRAEDVLKKHQSSRASRKGGLLLAKICAWNAVIAKANFNAEKAALSKKTALKILSGLQSTDSQLHSNIRELMDM